MRRIIYLILAGNAVGLIAFTLFFYLGSGSINSKNNGFNRLYLSKVKCSNPAGRYLDYPCYIAGLTSHIIYLANLRDSGVVTSLTLELKDSNNVVVKNKDSFDFGASCKALVDSPEVYIYDGNRRLLLSESLPNLRNHNICICNYYFILATPVSFNSYITRTYNSTKEQSYLVKQGLALPIFEKSYILEKQIEGLYSTEGTLLYNKVNARAIYVYKYRNEFICLDSNLTNAKAWNTIDTTKSVKLKIATATINGVRGTTIASPSYTVNRFAYTYGKYIFIASNLCSDNESKEKFYKNTTVDIYSVEDGKYWNSFYIPDHEGLKVNEFAIVDSSLVALYDNYICNYKFTYF